MSILRKLGQLRYRDIVVDPDGALSRIFDFLGVHSSRSVLASCAHQASFEKLSGGRKTGEEDRASLFRKGVIGDWRNHLTTADEAAFRQIAEPWMQRFGYT